MSRGYPLVPLSEAIHYKSDFIEIDDFQTYKRCRVQLHAQGIVERDAVPGAEIKTKKQQVCKANEFLVAEIDAKLGGFGIVPENLEGAIVSSHYFLFSINEDVLNRRYLNFFIRTPDFLDQVRAQGSTNYAAIRPSDVLGYKIPLPTPEEQQRIVARIEELVAKIEEAQGLRREAVEETEEFWTSCLGAVFKNLTKDYNSRTFREFCDVVRGGSPRPAGDPTFYNGPIPFLKVADLTNEPSKFVTKYSSTIKEAGLNHSRYVEPNTLLLTNSGATLGVPKICQPVEKGSDKLIRKGDDAKRPAKATLIEFLSLLRPS